MSPFAIRFHHVSEDGNGQFRTTATSLLLMARFAHLACGSGLPRCAVTDFRILRIHGQNRAPAARMSAGHAEPLVEP